MNPAAGTYTVVVQGWGVVGSSPFKLHTWLLGSAAAGNMTVTAPATAVVAQTGTINIATSGLDAGHEVPRFRRLRRHDGYAQPDDRAHRPLSRTLTSFPA